MRSAPGPGRLPPTGAGRRSARALRPRRTPSPVPSAPGPSALPRGRPPRLAVDQYSPGIRHDPWTFLPPGQGAQPGRSLTQASGTGEGSRAMRMEDMILVSVDDHVVEPPDLFDGHVPERYRDVAPRSVRK